MNGAPPLPPPTSAQPATVTPAPGQAAASAPSKSAVAITATCQLGEHPGIDEAEARTGADVLCHELAKARATNGQHEIRFGKLGGKTLIIVASRDGNAYDERRAFVNGMDEIQIASGRLVSALVENKTVAETKTVDTVLSSETPPPKVQAGSMGLECGLFGTTGIGSAANGSGGLSLALVYRGEHFGLSAAGRAGGIGSGEAKLGLATLDIGAHYYLSSSEIAPFVGGGFLLGYYDLGREKGADVEGSGVGSFVNIGVQFLRTHHASFTVAARADIPFFALESSEQYYSYGTPSTKETRYIVPLSLNVGVLFH